MSTIVDAIKLVDPLVTFLENRFQKFSAQKHRCIFVEVNRNSGWRQSTIMLIVLEKKQKETSEQIKHEKTLG